MAVEENPGSAVIDAVYRDAMRWAGHRSGAMFEARRLAKSVQDYFDQAAEYREKFDQCVEWLDVHAPEWKQRLSEVEQEHVEEILGDIILDPA